MSRSIALVKFDDDTIMKTCYDGTSDVLSRFLITEKDLDEKFDSDIFAFDDWCVEHYNEMHKDPDEITDSEHVEIYVDYGGGSMWMDCTASRSAMYITSDTDYYYVNDEETIAQWVIDYHLKNGMKIDMFRGRIEQAEVTATLISETIITDEEYEESIRSGNQKMYYDDRVVVREDQSFKSIFNMMMGSFYTTRR